MKCQKEITQNSTGTLKVLSIKSVLCNLSALFSSFFFLLNPFFIFVLKTLNLMKFSETLDRSDGWMNGWILKKTVKAGVIIILKTTRLWSAFSTVIVTKKVPPHNQVISYSLFPQWHCLLIITRGGTQLASAINWMKVWINEQMKK